MCLLLAVLCVGDVGAVDDGQYDYGNPYLTLDPETGELVAVDPRKDAGAEHENIVQQSTAASNQDQAMPLWWFTALAAGVVVIIGVVAWLWRSRTPTRRTRRIAT